MTEIDRRFTLWQGLQNGSLQKIDRQIDAINQKMEEQTKAFNGRMDRLLWGILAIALSTLGSAALIFVQATSEHLVKGP